MKYKWLNRLENENIIVFFNGWGMDENVVKHLKFANYDVIMFYDYNSFDTNFDFDILKNYQKCHIVAWSMGVMTATLFNFKFDSATAINGTLKPIDNMYGIPERIYELTLKNLTPQSIKKFIQNMFNENNENLVITRDFENQKSELSALKEYSANLDFKYTKILISNQDKIIPTKNQEAFWKMNSNITSSHAPFNLFKEWKELL